MVAVSVIIPTTGRDSIRRTLIALAAQDDPPPFEVIIGVDGPAPLEFGGSPVHQTCTGMRSVVTGRRQGVAVARNAAIAEARGGLLGFIDDDVVPSPTWVHTVQTQLQNHEAVTGRILEDDCGGTLARLRRLAFDQRHRTNLQAGQPIDYLHGGNFAVRADLLQDVGVFNQAYIKSQDRELARRIIHAGKAIHYAPELVVFHRAHYTLLDLWRGRYRAGRAAATMLRNGALTSLGPATTRETYGETISALARRAGNRVAGAAALSILAYRLGRLRPLPPTPRQLPRSFP